MAFLVILLVLAASVRNLNAQLPSAAPTPVPSPVPSGPSQPPTFAPSPFSLGSFIKIATKDPTTWDRHDFCGAMQKVADKTALPKGFSFAADTLKGQIVTFGIEAPGNVDSAYLTYDSNTGFPNGGYFYELHQKLASIGGFYVNYIQLPAIDAKQTLGQYAAMVTDYCDVYSGRPLSDTSGNRLLGLDFTVSVNDLSQFLITREVPAVVDTTWGFAAPFTPNLWVVIVMILLFNGLIFASFAEKPDEGVGSLEFTESGASQAARRSGVYTYFFYLYNKWPALTENIYLSLGRFVGAGGLEPKTVPMLFTNVAFCFIIFILLGYYTANLATFLIAAPLFSTPINSIDEANSAGAKICVHDKTNSANILTTFFPNVAQQPQPVYAALGLATGQCVAAYITKSDFKIAKTRTALDAACNVVQVGPIVRKVSGAWAIKSDWSTKCSSFMNEVLTSQFLQLAASDYMNEAFEVNLEKNSDLVCPESPPASASLTPESLKGVFYVYAFSIAICIGMHVVYTHGVVLLQSRMEGKGGVSGKNGATGQAEPPDSSAAVFLNSKSEETEAMMEGGDDEGDGEAESETSLDDSDHDAPRETRNAPSAVVVDGTACHPPASASAIFCNPFAAFSVHGITNGITNGEEAFVRQPPSAAVRRR